tara:strand:- start:145 stop:507 length:363 start_codon:yes stop_codon:yes gene_type:complete
MSTTMKRSDLKRIIKEEYIKILQELEVVPVPKRTEVEPIVVQGVKGKFDDKFYIAILADGTIDAVLYGKPFDSVDQLCRSNPMSLFKNYADGLYEGLGVITELDSASFEISGDVPTVCKI